MYSAFVKLNCLMNSLQNQPVFEDLIKSCNVNDVLLLVEQIGNQLLDPIDLPLLTHEWEIIVQVMQVIRVRHITLQELILPSFLSQLTDAALKLVSVLHPFKPASWEVLANCPTIQVICIQVMKVSTLFPRIKPITHVLVVCLPILMNCLSDATSSTSPKHQQHIGVGYELQVNVSLLKAGLLSQSGRGVEVSWIKNIML